MSDNVRDMFDALYRQFLLRDVFGKVIPGLILLTAIAATFDGFATVGKTINSMSFESVVLAIGIGWLAGFAVQSLGELSSLIIYFPKIHVLFQMISRLKLRPWRDIRAEIISIEDIQTVRDRLHVAYFETEQDWFEFRNPLFSELSENNPFAVRQIERLIVIKEACGNGYVSLLVSLLPIYLATRADPFSPIILVVILLFAVILGRMHFKQVERQYSIYVEFVTTNVWKSTTTVLSP